MVQDNHRHVCEFEHAGCDQPAVPGDDTALGIDQNRVEEPELDDAGGNLGHLIVRVRPGIPGVGDQPIQFPDFNPLRHHGRTHKATS